MLIRSIKAENFMRFANLELRNLPPRGVIAIEGSNESGKTTIGEAILFAFFGKTPKNKALPVSQLIRWNTDKLSVEVEFTIEGKGDFLIYREIDKYGTNYVKLLDASSRRELGVGHIKVSQLLTKYLRFDYLEFQNSFYLNQFQAIDHYGVDPEFLESMTGSKQIQETIRKIDLEIDELEREYSLYEKDIQRNQHQIEKYNATINNLDGLREGVELISKESREVDSRKTRFDKELKSFNEFSRTLAKSARQLENSNDCTISSIQEVLSEDVAAYEKFEAYDKNEVTGEETPREIFVNENQGSYQSQRALCAELSQWASRYVDLRDRVISHKEYLSKRISMDFDEGLPARQESMEVRCQQQKRTCWRLSCWALLFLIPAAFFGVTSGLVLAESAQAEAIWETLARANVAKDQAPAVLIGASTLFFSIFLILTFMRASAGSKKRQFTKELQEVRKEIQDSENEKEMIEHSLSTVGYGEIGVFLNAVGKINELEIQNHYNEFFKTNERWGKDEEGFRRLLCELRQSQFEIHEKGKSEIKKLEKKLQEFVTENNRRRSEKNRINIEIKDGEASSNKKMSLVTKNDELEEKAQSLHHDIDLRRVAIKLLEETRVKIRSQIGPTLSNFIREVLPILTQNRYRDLKVDSELNLNLFNTDKNDFMDIAELSGGTLECLKLALRLAVSQALIQSRAKQAQFVFLDEPLKMADPSRADDILSSIRKLSPDMQQIFIIQPMFTDEQRDAFEWVIHTDGESGELVRLYGNSDPGDSSANPDASDADNLSGNISKDNGSSTRNSSGDDAAESQDTNFPGASNSILQT